MSSLCPADAVVSCDLFEYFINDHMEQTDRQLVILKMFYIKLATLPKRWPAATSYLNIIHLL